jgi:O-antigen/teichoic acid export membrane protein
VKSKKLIKLFPSVLFSFSNILNLGITLLASLVLSLFKNNEADFGKAIFALSLINTITYLNESGFSETVQVFAIEKKYQKIFRNILKRQFILNLFWGAIMFGIAVLSGFSYKESFLMLPCIFYSQLNTLIAGFAGLNQKIRAFFYQTMMILISLVGIFVLSFSFDNTSATIIGLGLGIGICVVLVILDYKIQGLLDEGVELDSKLNLFAKSTFWYYICFLLLSQSDIFILNYFLGIEYVGVYKTIAQIANLFKIPAILVSVPLLPYLSEKLKNSVINSNIGKIRSILQKIIFSLFLFSTLTIGLIYVFGDWFLRLVYGFEGSSFLLTILALAFIFEGLSFLLITFFQALEKTQIVWKITLFQLLTYLVLMISAARSLYSAGLIILLVQILGLACHFYFFLRYTKSDYIKKHLTSQSKA